MTMKVSSSLGNEGGKDLHPVPDDVEHDTQMGEDAKEEEYDDDDDEEEYDSDGNVISVGGGILSFVPGIEPLGTGSYATVRLALYCPPMTSSTSTASSVATLNKKKVKGNDSNRTMMDSERQQTRRMTMIHAATATEYDPSSNFHGSSTSSRVLSSNQKKRQRTTEEEVQPDENCSSNHQGVETDQDAMSIDGANTTIRMEMTEEATAAVYPPSSQQQERQRTYSSVLVSSAESLGEDEQEHNDDKSIFRTHSNATKTAAADRSTAVKTAVLWQPCYSTQDCQCG